jgi:hypothetical protein
LRSFDASQRWQVCRHPSFGSCVVPGLAEMNRGTPDWRSPFCEKCKLLLRPARLPPTRVSHELQSNIKREKARHGIRTLFRFLHFCIFAASMRFDCERSLSLILTANNRPILVHHSYRYVLSGAKSENER